jgi:hypothetical protein
VTHDGDSGLCVCARACARVHSGVSMFTQVVCVCVFLLFNPVNGFSKDLLLKLTRVKTKLIFFTLVLYF